MKNTVNDAVCRRAAAAFLAAALACTALTACAQNGSSKGNVQKKENNPSAASVPNPGTDAPLPRGGKIEQLAKAVYPVKEYKNEDEKWEAELEERQMIDADLCEKIAYFAYDTASPLLKEGTGNAVYSPLSLYYALSLAAAGAEGETRSQILSLLRADDADELAERAGKQFAVFWRDEDSYKFQMANSVWFDQALSVKDTYLQTAADSFYADIFRGKMNTANMKDAMETWGQDHTGGRIRPSINTENSLMRMMNTVYYYAEWIDQFAEEETKEDDFHLSDGSLVKCDFMNRISSGMFFKRNGYLSASLSTKNGQVQFILPDEGVDVRELFDSPDRLRQVLETDDVSGLYGEITWKVPKFSYGSKYDLKEMLASLGMEKAFGDSAEFTAMTDEMVWIDSATQMVHVGVNENGIEAAAYTDLGYAGAGMPQDHAEMILDRPFLFVVRDSYCGYSPVFIGICGDPSSAD